MEVRSLKHLAVARKTVPDIKDYVSATFNSKGGPSFGHTGSSELKVRAELSWFPDKMKEVKPTQQQIQRKPKKLNELHQMIKAFSRRQVPFAHELAKEPSLPISNFPKENIAPIKTKQ